MLVSALVVLAMVTSFVVAVFVLPGVIASWARYGPSLETEPDTGSTSPRHADD